MSYYLILHDMLFHFILLFIIFYNTIFYCFLWFLCLCTLFIAALFYFMLYCVMLYLLCQKNPSCQHAMKLSALEYVSFHCFGGCVADTTISAMEVVSSFPVPITRLAHRATDLVKDQGLWVDVKFLHANNPGKQVLQHGCKWMSPFFWDIERYSRPDWRLTIWTSPFLGVWLESW